ncbi:MAG TPA: hypothetical protein PLZ93_03130 [Nocardioides sp.]|uniref:hypothetical protein n=1 Tax=uncultured Nocardioides sp. TaxID=198441 RepID=UPI00261AEECD|nr:hypothetical protein [uncultured Nocardioides sp.]HRD62188.1 hypothetical protein [Nocardioides sp.]HRI94584.1 hypothetical protein [Nocardioides sp.]HRK44920.1 hypothetical protein [Nocardioides sp.]
MTAPAKNTAPRSALPETTLEGLESRSQDVAGLWGRRAFVTVICLVVVAALAGFLGVRSATVDAREDGWSVSLEYPSVARAGLDVTFRATVRHEGGFGDSPGTVTLALTGDYLNIYEEQGFHPDPSASRRDEHTLYLTFDAPTQGDTFVVSYDAYVQPSSQQGRAGTLAVLTDGREVAVVPFRTRLLP